MKKALLLFISMALIVSMAGVAFSTSAVDIEQAIDVLDYLYLNIPELKFGNEWAVLALARSAYKVSDKYFENYYKNIETLLKENDGILPNSTTKKTEYSRLILALNAIGKDPQNVGGYDLTAWLSSLSRVEKQGINGSMYALLALDSGNYDIPDIAESALTTGYTADKNDQNTRQKMIDSILEAEVKKGTADAGGFALTGSTPDIDVSAMALQSLARYRSDSLVNAAIERTLSALSRIQNSDGTFSAWGYKNAESISQMIIALCMLDIDLKTDIRFIKNGNNLLDALKLFEVNKAYRHTLDTAANGLATEQAACALVAYARFADNANNIYDMNTIDDWDIYYKETTSENPTTKITTEESTTAKDKEENKISSNIYTIKNGFIMNIPENTDAAAFLSGINEKNVKLFNADSTQTDSETQIGTGMSLKLYSNGEIIDELTTVLMGDVDGNGKISPQDARHALRHAVKIAILEGAFLAAADLDGDGVVGVDHARKILRYAVKLETYL